ncbi:hypothetical protein ZOSMA_1G03410 [Zostera marina]|uniref:Sorting nexin-13 n=1 Tax=Zostera marina TaxID=29655 RepID=A0A0K9PN13_ZOSMR|nr:hypothetical protein ZOSMA_1G03410 [Zostera marina]
MDALQNLIDEAKIRAVWWGFCIFGISYFLSHTSKSIWTNIPISFLILCGLRYLSYVAELRWRSRPIIKTSYLSHLQRRQISIKNPLLSPLPPMASWKQKINSPLVESAVRDFVNKLMQDFVMDLWYSSITQDKDAPVLIRGLILDAIGEISARIKEINLVELLTKDAVELISDHLEMFRRYQSSIGGAKVISTLSHEQIDEKLKCYMLDCGDLHPAIRSPECEYKVLQRLAGGVLTSVLEPRDVQSPLVKCFSRELLTCLVLQPVMNLASPAYINELIEVLFLCSEEGNSNTQADNAKATSSCSETLSITNQSTFQKSLGNHSHVRTAEWAKEWDAKTQRRTQVLASENIENMWTKGRNYKKKTDKLAKSAISSGTMKINSKIFDNYVHENADKEMATNPSHSTMNLADMDKTLSSEEGHFTYDQEDKKNLLTLKSKRHLRRSSSTSDINNKLGFDYLKMQDNTNTTISRKNREGSDPRVVLDYSTFVRQDEDSSILRTSQPLPPTEEYFYSPKLKCRVKGVAFEKTGSSSFAVYSIDVTDAKNTTWSVKRRYRNFERLHRNLKDIPNYNLQLPPKRILSSNLDDRFVNQRVVLLNKYLQDLLSIANIAEKHEVWDFLSVASKNYSYGKSTSVMKTIAVNVDDVVIDFVRQFKGGLRNKIVGTPSFSHTISPSEKENKISLVYPEENISKSSLSDNLETPHSLSDDEGSASTTSISGWHSDNEVNSKYLDYKRSNPSGHYQYASNALATSGLLEDQIDATLEWSALNMPLLNLVDKLFQLKQRGWLRRQVLWLSKQILQLMMGDTIDVYLMRPINLLRRDDFIAQMIRRVQDVLWPDGIFFTKLEDQRKEVDFQNTPKLSPCSSFKTTGKVSIYFEQQLEATRRAKDVKKLILDGAPAALVNLIGQNQYRRSSKDIYHFLQSSICIKQLAYGILELLLVSIFPELRDLIEDIHLKSHSQSVK